MVITDYKTLTAFDTNSLTEQVCVLLKQGWQPYGNIVCVTDGTHTESIQVMVKYSTENRTKIKYSGIYRLPTGRWRAQIYYKKKQYNIGVHDTALQAVKARNAYIIEHKLPHALQVVIAEV